MSGWLLLFLAIAVCSMPSFTFKAEGGASIRWLVAQSIAGYLAWAAVVIGLLAGALRTGGLL